MMRQEEYEQKLKKKKKYKTSTESGRADKVKARNTQLGTKSNRCENTFLEPRHTKIMNEWIYEQNHTSSWASESNGSGQSPSTTWCSSSSARSSTSWSSSRSCNSSTNSKSSSSSSGRAAVWIGTLVLRNLIPCNQFEDKNNQWNHELATMMKKMNALEISRHVQRTQPCVLRSKRAMHAKSNTEYDPEKQYKTNQTLTTFSDTAAAAACCPWSWQQRGRPPARGQTRPRQQQPGRPCPCSWQQPGRPYPCFWLQPLGRHRAEPDLRRSDKNPQAKQNISHCSLFGTNKWVETVPHQRFPMVSVRNQLHSMNPISSEHEINEQKEMRAMIQ